MLFHSVHTILLRMSRISILVSVILLISINFHFHIIHGCGMSNLYVLLDLVCLSILVLGDIVYNCAEVVPLALLMYLVFLVLLVLSIEDIDF